MKNRQKHPKRNPGRGTENLRKENSKLKAQKEADKAKNPQT